jgi:predicted  nucleic acid-binding Zn-ribbon protein
LRSKWNKIGEIYKSISTAPAEKKIDTIDKNIPLMEQIEEDVKNINQYIDRQSKRLRDALYKNIAIDGLSSKIEDKFLRFFERRINEPKGKATAPLDTQDN